MLAKDASVGKPLDELPKIQVWVTLDGGHEDIEAYQQYGHRLNRGEVAIKFLPRRIARLESNKMR